MLIGEMELNHDVLIRLIKERPVLWDRTLDDNRDKGLKVAAWNEVCCGLNKDFAKMDEDQQKVYGTMVQKKWTHTRDAWLKSVKRQIYTKNTSSKGPRPYIYHKKLNFLNKLHNFDELLPGQPESSPDNSKAGDESSSECEAEEPQQEVLETPPKIQKTDDVEERIIALIERWNKQEPKKEEVEDRHLCFFKSLLPSLSNLEDDQILEFQSGVLDVLRRVKYSRGR